MNSKKNKWLTTSLKVSLYVILATGTVFALAIYGIIPPVLVNGAKILIALHKILGYIFLGLILCHALSYRKWYKVWFSGK
ncbi:MAG: hypothetical protein LBU22_02455, partial [Dysgonamonadaceae bacterium]|nr:hypothetical protein [Dysgonamonadaceae bacterium]